LKRKIASLALRKFLEHQERNVRELVRTIGMKGDKMHRTFKILGGAIGTVVLIGLGIYLIGSYFPELFFYNPAYGENTQLRGYVLTDEQIVHAGGTILPY
jgi:hypothetical protein